MGPIALTPGLIVGPRALTLGWGRGVMEAHIGKDMADPNTGHRLLAQPTTAHSVLLTCTPQQAMRVPQGRWDSQIQLLVTSLIASVLAIQVGAWVLCRHQDSDHNPLICVIRRGILMLFHPKDLTIEARILRKDLRF